MSKNGDRYCEDADAALSYESLQRNIEYCKYKMAPEASQKPRGYFDSKEYFS